MENNNSFIPDYNYASTEALLIDCGDDTTMLYFKDANADDLEAYCKKLEIDGFDMIDRRTVEKNVFYTFVKGDKYIYAYYTDFYKVVRVIGGPLSTLGIVDNTSTEEARYTPAFSMIGQTEHTNCGQGAVVLLPDGRLLVHDSGFVYQDKPDYMYKALKELAPDPDNIVVAAWYISHPHEDHQFGFEEFLEKHGEEKCFKLQSVVYNYGKAEQYDFLRKDGTRENCANVVVSIHDKVAKYAPEAKVIKAHTGQIFDFGKVTVEVVFTIDDIYPITLDYVNSASLVIRVTCEGQSIMMLADTTHFSGRILENMFTKHLKSDMVQLAHHGMWASNPSLYETIAANIVLWPNIEPVAKIWLEDRAIVTALSTADDVYIAGTGIITLTLPHKIENNKETVINSL